MCIIAIKPENKIISEETLRNMWDNNDDGAGFMYADRGKVRLVKGLMTFDAFLKAYRKVGEHRKIVMHFRIKTHGAVSPELTHPFWISKGNLAMVHNGIISGMPHHGAANESDTSLYAKILAHRYPDPLEALTSPEEHARIVKEIGWSKLVFMTADGEHLIVNEKSGDWDNGCWYSNTSYSDTYKKYGGWASYYTSSDYVPGSYLARNSSETTLAGTAVEGLLFDDVKETTQITESALTVRGASDADEAEWAALIARYEAKYGTAED